MAVKIQYVVEHKGVEKLVTIDKKAADKYDKMLEVADNVAGFLQQKGFSTDEALLEELSVLLSKNKDSMSKLFKGAQLETVLAEDAADVVSLEKAKKTG